MGTVYFTALRKYACNKTRVANRRYAIGGNLRSPEERDARIAANLYANWLSTANGFVIY